LIKGEQVVRGVNQSGRIAQERLRGQQRTTCLRGVLPRGFVGSLERGEDEAERGNVLLGIMITRSKAPTLVL
jgi:hypothetical protein